MTKEFNDARIVQLAAELQRLAAIDPIPEPLWYLEKPIDPSGKIVARQAHESTTMPRSMHWLEHETRLLTCARCFGIGTIPIIQLGGGLSEVPCTNCRTIRGAQRHKNRIPCHMRTSFTHIDKPY
jgi:hypothetical protein